MTSPYGNRAAFFCCSLANTAPVGVASQTTKRSGSKLASSTSGAAHQRRRNQDNQTARAAALNQQINARLHAV